VLDTLATVAAILLAGTFLIAASLKLVNPAATRRSMQEFGLPRPHVVAVAVPVTELATAALLLVDPRTGGPCAVALLVAFTTLMTHLPADPASRAGQGKAPPVQPVGLLVSLTPATPRRHDDRDP
jgi:uncharacterized membrane protein YphA (DoxX/SURF4 family)